MRNASVWPSLAVLGALTVGCVTQTIDEATGTTLEQRCQDYRLALLAGDLVYGSSEWLDLLRAFQAAGCRTPENDFSRPDGGVANATGD